MLVQRSATIDRRTAFLWIAELLLLLLLLGGTLGADDGGGAARIKSTIDYLAADELEGRGVDSEGIQKAAEYVSSAFAELGAEVQAQTFSVPLNAELDPAGENRLRLVGPTADSQLPQSVQLELAKQFSPLAIGGSGTLDAPLVFAGYGIVAEEYDDYADLDVAGKVVLLLRKEPQQDNDESAFAGSRPSRHAFFSTKIDQAAQHGAAGVILVNDQFGIDKAASDARSELAETIDELSALRHKHAEVQQPSEQEDRDYLGEVGRTIDRLVRVRNRIAGDFDELLDLGGAGESSEHPELPVFFARRADLESVIKQSLGSDLASIEAAIDKDLVPRSQLLAGWRVQGAASILRKSVAVKNVVATLPGAGPLSEEFVVVGAHYDHLGWGGPGSLAPWTKEIHNGADDNASGTAALIEVARRLAAADSESRRTIVLIAFAGEERGLLGSAHYVKQPLYPLAKTVGMVNMDMVGRLNDDLLTIYGTGTADTFDSLVDALNERHAFEITKEPHGQGPSDHATFYQQQIPVLHFYTGMHRDYHRPSDDVETVNLAGVERVAAMVAELVAQLAHAPSRPEFQETRRRGRRRGR